MESFPDDVLIRSLNKIFDLEQPDKTKQRMDDLKKDFVARIFSLFMQDFGCQLDALSMLPLEGDPPRMSAQYPELYRKTFFNLSLASAIKLYIEKISNDNSFEINDLLMPDPKRTRYFFSLFLSFYSTVNDQLPQLESFQKKIDKLKEEKDHLISLVKALKQDKKKSLMRQTEQAMRHKEIVDSIESKKIFVQELQEIKSRLRQSLETIKEERIQIEIATDDMKANISDADREIEALSVQIICDEERKQMVERGKSVQNRKENLDELEERNKSLQKKFDSYERIVELLKSFNTLLSDIENEKMKQSDAYSAQKNMAAKTSMVLEKHQELLERNCALEENFKSVVAKREQLLFAQKEMKKNNEEDILSKKKMLDEVHQKVNNNNSENKEILSNLKKIQPEIQNVRSSIDEFKTFVDGIVDAIQKKIQHGMAKDPKHYSAKISEIKELLTENS